MVDTHHHNIIELYFFPFFLHAEEERKMLKIYKKDTHLITAHSSTNLPKTINNKTI